MDYGKLIGGVVPPGAFEISDIEWDKRALKRVLELGREHLAPEGCEDLESALVDICLQQEGWTLENICDIFPE